MLRTCLLLPLLVLLLPSCNRQPCAAAVAVLYPQWLALVSIRDGLDFLYPSRSPKAFWTSRSDCSLLFGAGCDSLGNVVSLSLYDAIGTIPSALGDLTALLSLAANGDIASLPASTTQLTSLTLLSFSKSGLTGAFPSVISALKKLKDLKLPGNSLSGPLPPFLSTLTSLTTLRLDSNLFTGSIPAGLSKLTALTILSFPNNLLTGSLPPSLSALRQLVNIDLRRNKLTGSIPSQYSTLTGLEGIHSPSSL
ncbi:hypothetical protein CLOM_g14526 [Closterium sp. NIES-68]|nr:hypothetical protein CLOM_g14526 [Closterium sp. NIES-68]